LIEKAQGLLEGGLIDEHILDVPEGQRRRQIKAKSMRVQHRASALRHFLCEPRGMPPAITGKNCLRTES
ncbi:MAG: hypothetical protein JSW12_07425, partial [Deltaproteobacteria bacterium]